MLKITADESVATALAANTGRTANRRRGTGKPFVPGRSGNPSGRPKRTPEELDLITACKAKTPEALAVIEDLMATSRNDRVRMDAALAIIERAHGKPLQPSALTGRDGGPVQVEAIRTDYEALKRSLADLHSLRASLREGQASQPDGQAE